MLLLIYFTLLFDLITALDEGDIALLKSYVSYKFQYISFIVHFTMTGKF